MSVVDAAAQLADELGQRAHALAVATGGPDCSADDAVGAAGRLATQLASGDHQAAETVMAALWPDPLEPPPEWWHTPLGRLAARSVGADDAEAVTYARAAAMLGVHSGTVKQWVHRGTLDRHPAGGVLRSSILQRLART